MKTISNGIRIKASKNPINKELFLVQWSLRLHVQPSRQQTTCVHSCMTHASIVYSM